MTNDYLMDHASATVANGASRNRTYKTESLKVFPYGLSMPGVILKSPKYTTEPNPLRIGLGFGSVLFGAGNRT